MHDKVSVRGLGLPCQPFWPQPRRPPPEVHVPSPAPPPPGPLARLADLTFRRRWAVLAVWVVALVAAFGASGAAGDWAADYSTPGSESKAAAQLLQERFPERNPETVEVVWQVPEGAGSANVAQRIDRLATEADA